jgi:hypothetical protein
MKSKTIQIAVLSLVISTFSLQVVKADCYNSYVNRVNEIGNTVVPPIYKQKVYKSVLEHLGATLVGGMAGSMGGFIIALGGGCLDTGFVGAPICNALAVSSIVLGLGAANAGIYEQFDKTDSSEHDGALATKKQEMSDINLPFLALTELHNNHPDANIKKVFDMVSALADSSAQSLSEAQFIQVLSTLNSNNDFCQNAALSTQNEMIRKLKSAVETYELSHQ